MHRSHKKTNVSGQSKQTAYTENIIEYNRIEKKIKEKNHGRSERKFNISN